MLKDVVLGNLPSALIQEKCLNLQIANQQKVMGIIYINNFVGRENYPPGG